MAEPEDYLQLMPSAHADHIRRRREEFEARVSRPKKGFLRFQQPHSKIVTLPPARHTIFDSDTITLGLTEEMEEGRREELGNALRAFMPWRKGPFSIFGVEIDAEWLSFRKWERLRPGLPDLSGKVVADIGCNNGYYMFRMLPHNPAAVVGFEPTLQHYYCLNSLRHLAGAKELFSEPLGVEDMGLYPDSFDVIFLMGVIYHRNSPLGVLKEIREALRPGGVLIVESQAIAGDQSLALFPEKTYAKAPGVYFVPTAPCLKNWLLRSGFREVELISQVESSSEEQRRSAWMEFESYADFINPQNPKETIEGYPAPQRVIFSASG